MTDDAKPPGDDVDAPDAAPTIVVAGHPRGSEEDSLWSRRTADPDDAAAKVDAAQAEAAAEAADLAAVDAAEAAAEAADVAADAAEARSAADRAADARDRASDAKDRATGKASDAKQRAGARAGEARERASSFAASARERASNTDVKELAASTTSLIDTARPFFLAFFAVLFTVLAFVGGDSGTSQLFVVGAILCVLAAGFSDELSHIVPPHRRQARDEDERGG